MWSDHGRTPKGRHLKNNKRWKPKRKYDNSYYLEFLVSRIILYDQRAPGNPKIAIDVMTMFDTFDEFNPVGEGAVVVTFVVRTLTEQTTKNRVEIVVISKMNIVTVILFDWFRVINSERLEVEARERGRKKVEEEEMKGGVKSLFFRSFPLSASFSRLPLFNLFLFLFPLHPFR